MSAPPSAEVSTARNIPAGFDVDGFVRQAKQQFNACRQPMTPATCARSARS